MLESVDKYKSPSLYFSQVSFQIQIRSLDMTVSYEQAITILDDHGATTTKQNAIAAVLLKHFTMYVGLKIPTQSQALRIS